MAGMSTAIAPAPSSTSRTIGADDLSVDGDRLDVVKAASIYRQHGCLVVRGLHREYVAGIAADVAQATAESWAGIDQARKAEEGWWLQGSLFIAGPPDSGRERQLMLVGLSYRRSAAMLRSAIDERTCHLAAEVLGPNVELMDDGQVVQKEPVGGHAKWLHQDSAYFQHRDQGPFACLIYLVDTDLVNGALHVVPGSHQLGYLPHVDTSSHLGLPPAEWPMERGTPIIGKAGDAIFFHQHMVHGSPANRSQAVRPVCIHRYRAIGDSIIAHATTAANRAHNGAESAEKREREVNRLVVHGRRTLI